jgi:ferredoxin-type protein NapH
MAAEVMPFAALQRRRRATQVGFFALFLLAPSLDLLRFDLTEAQLWLLGQRWTLGLDAFLHGQATAVQAAWAIVLRGIVPVLLLVGLVLGVAWRYGRLYCGWLCPHFALVEGLNGLLHRAVGKFSLWDRHVAPGHDGKTRRRWGLLFALCAAGFGFLWAVTLLTYLLPPAMVWGNLLHGTLTPNQARFIGIGGALFTAELVLARHLFCRFGCAVGLFQSLAWMANPRALVVAFDRRRATACRGCHTVDAPLGSVCDAVCPMRLRPRNIKRMMFACVQCGRCVAACASSHQARGSAANLQWSIGVDALRETLRQRR